MHRAGILAIICWMCFLGHVSALGWISPRDPIGTEVNGSFSMQCTLDMQLKDIKGLNSSNLMFYRSDEPVPREQVKILNASTIELTVERAVPYPNYAYTCKVNNTQGVAMRSVYIGHKPRVVKDFKCRAPLWDKHMVCTFTPDPNTIPTTYELILHFLPFSENFVCTLDIDKQTNQSMCIIKTDPGYRSLVEYYNFVLTAKNLLGTLSQQFIINHFDVVVPHEPVDCVIEDITSDSAVLKFKKWYRYEAFRRSFICEVKLLTLFDNNVWHTVSNDGLTLNHRDYTLPLRNLPYAATQYDVRIRMRTNSTEEGEDLWSNHTSCLFDTLPRKPDLPPDVPLGGFEDSNEQHLFVYWRELDNWQHNARSGFYYNITMEGPNGKIIERINSTVGMIDRHRVPDTNYTFQIRSANPEGNSERSSELFVPSRRHRLGKPLIDKLLSDSGQFALSWKPPSSAHPTITSYTVFWCNTTSNSPNDCNGSINFTSVTPNQTTFLLSDAGSTLNFAVAANSGRLSSGMVWAACTATHKSDIGKLKTIWITDMLSSYIHLKWKTECGDVAHTGYIVYYCPIASPRTLGCKEPEQFINVTNKNQHSCRLEPLKPYVTYKIEIAMYSETDIGPRSEPLVNTTREAAPSSPRNVSVLEITNRSITLHLDPPEHINGGKMSYEIKFNEHILKYNVEDPGTEVNQTLENLDAFTEYNITVRAATIEFSNASEPVRVRTLVGKPQAIGQPSTNSSSDSKLTISWNPPAKPSGCVEFYELMVKAKQTVIYQQRKTECQLREAICQNRDSSKYEFLVRAVNVDIAGPNEARFRNLSCNERWAELNGMWPDLKRFVAYGECGTSDAIAERPDKFNWLDSPPSTIRLHNGPWSEPLAHWCAMENKNVTQWVLVTFIVGILIVGSGCSYIRVKHVLHVKVIMPEGLNDITGSGKPGFNSVLGPTAIIFTEHHRIDHIVMGSSTKEASYNKEQNQCLLTTSSSSGGSVADLSGHEQRSSADYCSNSNFEDDSNSFYDQEAERQDRHGYSDETTESIGNDLEHDRHLGSTSNRSNETDSSFSPMSQGNTGSPMMKGTNGSQNKSSALLTTVTSGYVPAPIISTKQPISSNGYMQVGALTNGSMMAPLDTMQKSLNAKMAAAPISGYVTHKQLSDYGQHLK
uniref:Fibronectin type-III domain-containing protein n=1 Tax=Anopheles minimus TaxID=112268 RepID=A0A182W8G9_9DIPT